MRGWRWPTRRRAWRRGCAPLGVATFVLKYRLGDYRFPAPLQDVLRAVRIVRSRAAEFGVRPDRIGVMGASAGGHLAGLAGTLFDAPEGRTGSALDAVSGRPDFLALLYPVVQMDGAVRRIAGRCATCWGRRPSAALVARTSVDRLVRADTPPAFLVHTSADRSGAAREQPGAPCGVAAGGRAERAARLRAGRARLRASARSRADVGVARSMVRVDAGARVPAVGRRDVLRRPARQPAIRAASRAGPAASRASASADLGNGTFLNPILSGDHPDPSVLKDGDDYYMTFSSFDAYPGLVVWHSRDLVNWPPIGPALRKNVGAVWAPDLVKHGGRYYIYFPGVGPYRSNYVVWADDIRGPWSDPIDLKIGRIDPGHAVGPDGRRYLFLSAGYRATLAPDGLSVVGEPVKVYDGWPIPASFVIEGFAQEGPKILRRGDYYYMVLAQGGTAGPPTGHMIVAARSRSIDGPWEHSPHNPIVRTRSAAEPWWSKGPRHAGRGCRRPLVDGLPRLREGLPHAGPADPARAGRMDRRRLVPRARRRCRRSRSPSRPGARGPHGFAFSDDFSHEPDGRAVELLRRRRRRRVAGALREWRAGAACEGRRAGHELAAVVRVRRSRLRDRGGHRRRSGRVGGAAAVLQPSPVRRARLLGQQLLHAQLRAGSAAGQAGRPSASGCASACATIGTS